MRQAHVYLGSFFCPLLIYFCISGAWQTFNLHKGPKDQPKTTIQSVLHALSNPHTDALSPNETSKDKNSFLFQILAVFMAIGFIATSLLGVQMAIQTKRFRKMVQWCLLAGTILPIVFLLIHPA